MQAFTVRLGKREIDRVFYSDSDKITVEDVKRSLVEHDGYDYRITVTKDRK